MAGLAYGGPDAAALLAPLRALLPPTCGVSLLPDGLLVLRLLMRDGFTLRRALIPVIEGAGGVITDWRGQPCPQGGRVLAAGDARIHAQALALLQSF